MNTTLLIMAAGLGSRFKGGIKQLEPVDDYGHIIMDYSIHDAIEAGFNEIIFIIRKDIEEDFKEVIGNRIEKVCEQKNVKVHYVFQDPYDIPGQFPEGRTKPWGTGQAVLSAKALIDNPFIVINADDYYGKQGFQEVHDYLIEKNSPCMAGFVLKNTLSENGGVTRGICEMDHNHFLLSVKETKNVTKDGDFDLDALCSMNMWGFPTRFMEYLENGFKTFFETEVKENPLQAEFLVPIFVQSLLQDSRFSLRVLQTNDVWHGITYMEDLPAVKESFHSLIDKGIYTKDLFDDLK